MISLDRSIKEYGRGKKAAGKMYKGRFETPVRTSAFPAKQQREGVFSPHQAASANAGSRDEALTSACGGYHIRVAEIHLPDGDFCF